MGALGSWTPCPCLPHHQSRLHPNWPSWCIQALAQTKKKKTPHVLILIWGMKVYIKQLLSGSSNSLYLRGFLFHSAGKFLLTIIAFEEPAGLGRVVGSFTSCLPVGGTEPGPA